MSEGRRGEFSSFGWDPSEVPDPQDVATFERSKLNWDEVDEQPHKDLLAWHRALIALRRSTPALTNGDLQRVHVAHDEAAGWLTVRRGPLTLAVNLADDHQAVAVPGQQLVLASDPGVALAGGEVRLPADSCAVIRG